MNRKYDARLNALKSEDFKKITTQCLKAFPSVDLAMIGGLAVAYYVNPPVTVDVDFIVSGTCGDVLEKAEEWFSHPWEISTLEFDGEIPAHCVRVRHSKIKHMIADFLPTGRNKYLRSIVERAVEVEVQPGLKIPIARVEDVIVLKTIAGREKDLSDNEAMGVKLGNKIDRAYIRRVLSGIVA